MQTFNIFRHSQEKEQSQLAFTYSKLAIETPEQGVKYV